MALHLAKSPGTGCVEYFSKKLTGIREMDVVR
jgi:hypothetical protein